MFCASGNSLIYLRLYSAIRRRSAEPAIVVVFHFQLQLEVKLYEYAAR